jgi:hypothetical protein
MGDPDLAAMARYQMESQELLRDHSRLTAQLELVERELERCSDPDRRQDLRGERVRIAETLSGIRARQRACVERSPLHGRGAD